MSQQPTRRLFVGSLPYKYSEGELLSLFVPFGKIIAVKIIKNKWGKSRGMGYVEFENQQDAVNAKEKLHRTTLAERSIIVDYAQPDPFLTPEGQLRHDQAQSKHHTKFKLNQPVRHPDRDHRQDSLASPPRVRGLKKGQKMRQSIFDSRAFGSRVGAKFARKNKRK